MNPYVKHSTSLKAASPLASLETLCILLYPMFIIIIIITTIIYQSCTLSLSWARKIQSASFNTLSFMPI